MATGNWKMSGEGLPTWAYVERVDEQMIEDELEELKQSGEYDKEEVLMELLEAEARENINYYGAYEDYATYEADIEAEMEHLKNEVYSQEQLDKMFEDYLKVKAEKRVYDTTGYWEEQTGKDAEEVIEDIMDNFKSQVEKALDKYFIQNEDNFVFVGNVEDTYGLAEELVYYSWNWELDLEPGYYEGFTVWMDGSFEDIKDELAYNIELTPEQEKEIEELLNVELDKFIDQLNEDLEELGMFQIEVTARFSSGETWYQKKEK